jgi:hypothetical protein
MIARPALCVCSALSLTTSFSVANTCSSVPTFADGLTPTSHIHVATDGSNSTGDGSAANPYATIAFAATHAAPGSAVVVRSGTYAGGGFISNLAGTAAAPIWIGGAPGEPRPIISGATEGLHLVECKYVILHDLEVRNASGNGINADDGGEVSDPLASHHLIFRDLSIHDIGGSGNQDGLKLSGINDFLVLNCDIARTGGGFSGSCIDMVGCHRGLIARCIFTDGSGSGVQAKGGSDDVEIRWCGFNNAGSRAVNIGGSTGFEFFRPPLSQTQPNFEARNIRVLANTFAGSPSPIAFVGCVNSTVAHNTIVNPTNWLVRILQETTTSPPYVFLPCANNTLASNILYFARSQISTHINIGANTAPTTFTFACNLWYSHDNPAQSTPNLPAPEDGGIYGQDPLLTNPAPPQNDSHIPTNSPAAHMGWSPPRVPGDFDGRCWCDPPAIGAFEIARTQGDVNCDGLVDADDLTAVILAWGPCPAPPAVGVCPADVNGSGAVDSDDLVVVVLNWS